MTTGDETTRTFADRYVLVSQLTTGESREVWKAHDDVVSRAVALKIWFGTPAADADWQARFSHDAARLVALSHPGIAKTYEHGESEAETWVAMAFVDAPTLAARLDDTTSPLTRAEVIDTIGQISIAIAAAHDAGIAHGAITPDAILLRSGSVPSVIGFDLGSEATRAADLHALGELTATCLGHVRTAASEPSAAVDDFLDWVTNPDRKQPPQEAAEIGRTALALATSLRGSAPSTARTVGEASKPVGAWKRDESPEQEAARKLVRNRLLVLGTIVVVGGAALLRFVGEGAGDVTVPTVTQLLVNSAALKLTSAGLVPLEVCRVGKDSGGVIVDQVPAAGAEVKAGSTVHLIVKQAVC